MECCIWMFCIFVLVHLGLPLKCMFSTKNKGFTMEKCETAKCVDTKSQHVCLWCKTNIYIEYGRFWCDPITFYTRPRITHHTKYLKKHKKKHQKHVFLRVFLKQHAFFMFFYVVLWLFMFFCCVNVHAECTDRPKT